MPVNEVNRIVALTTSYLIVDFPNPHGRLVEPRSTVRSSLALPVIPGAGQPQILVWRQPPF